MISRNISLISRDISRRPREIPLDLIHLLLTLILISQPTKKPLSRHLLKFVGGKGREIDKEGVDVSFSRITNFLS